jgi:Right handed beta helix region
MKFVLSLFCCFIVAAGATDHYVCADSTGSATGTDWTNAWPTLQAINWASISPGDTIYVAGGRYDGQFTIRKDGVKGAPITIQRVRATDKAATAAPGWKAIYDSQVVQYPPNKGDAIYWPGKVGNWFKISGRVNQGWHILRAGDHDAGNGVEIDQAAVSNVTLEYIYVEKPERSVQSNDMRGFDLTPTTGTMANIVMRHCEAKGGSAAMYLTLAENVLIEYCSFHDQDSLNVSQWHTNVVYCGRMSNSTFRYNKFYNITVEGLYLPDPGNSNVAIYGNLFYQGSIGRQSGARALQFGKIGNTGIRIYNNTFVGLPTGIQLANGSFSNCFFQNNIVYQMSLNLGLGWTSDHNLIAAWGDPFVNSASFDYHLKSQHPGRPLSAPYNIDYDGNLRTTWSVGAYEFQAPKR